jgi:hypothetical protein
LYCTNFVLLLFYRITNFAGDIVPEVDPYVFVGRHRFDADPDPDMTFHFDTDPDPDLDPTPSPTHVAKSGKIYLHSQQCQFTLFYLSVSVMGRFSDPHCFWKLGSGSTLK